MSGDEFGRGWRVLTASMLGLGLGSSALLFYTIGLFAVPLQQEIGLTRTQFGVATLLATAAVSLTAPFVGMAVDRIGTRRVALPSAVALSLGFVALAMFTHSVAALLTIITIVAGASTGTGPVSFTRAIAATFRRHRGVALGLALTGIGLSAAVTPGLIARAIASSGWRAGYAMLAVLAALGIGAALLLPRREPEGSSRLAAGSSPGGLSFYAAIRTRSFAALAIAFVLQSLSFGGLLPHLVPLLIDAGIPPLSAAGDAGLIGIAVIGSRLVAGWLTDRLFAPWIAAGTCLVCATGCGLLLLDPRNLAPIGALALGCAIGAEVDLIGFCAARYFGMRAYGRIYGTLYALFLTASGISPVWVGVLRDNTGTYAGALGVSATGLTVAAIAFLCVPAYPADHHER